MRRLHGFGDCSEFGKVDQNFPSNEFILTGLTKRRDGRVEVDALIQGAPVELMLIGRAMLELPEGREFMLVSGGVLVSMNYWYDHDQLVLDADLTFSSDVKFAPVV